MKHSINDHYTPTSYADGQSRLEARMMDGRTRHPDQMESMDMTTFRDMERQLDGTIVPSDMGLLDKFQTNWKSAKLRRNALTKVTEKKYDEIEKLACEVIESRAQLMRNALKTKFNRQGNAIVQQSTSSTMETLARLEEVNFIGQESLVDAENAIEERLQRMEQNGKLTPEKKEELMQLLRMRYQKLRNEFVKITEEAQQVVINAYSPNK